MGIPLGRWGSGAFSSFSSPTTSPAEYRAVQRERERASFFYSSLYLSQTHRHTHKKLSSVGYVCVQGGRGVWSKENMVNLCLQPPTVNPSGFSRVVVEKEEEEGGHLPSAALILFYFIFFTCLFLFLSFSTRRCALCAM